MKTKKDSSPAALQRAIMTIVGARYTFTPEAMKSVVFDIQAALERAGARGRRPLMEHISAHLVASIAVSERGEKANDA